MATVDGGMERNIVAIFHASFHPTRGNIIDWCLKVDEGINLEGAEFSALPSGLHLVERDTVYFSHASYSGLAIFRRRPTRSKGHRGFRLSSLGILLQDSSRPRPWLHLNSLRALSDTIYATADARETDVDLLSLGGPSSEPAQVGPENDGNLTAADFAAAEVWFNPRKADSLASPETWSGWSDELDGTYVSPNTPTHHLPHLLRILGLSSLTLYKFILSRRRVMIFTLPPVEVAGVLAWIASDLCREHHSAYKHRSLGVPIEGLLVPRSSDDDAERCRDPLRVLGMVTLSDLQRLEEESNNGRGWIACTTDAIFLEKPQYYDLIIDLTTSTPSKSSRPSLYMSKPVPPSPNGKRKASWKLESVRFTWSDVKLWSELDRILKRDSAQTTHHAHLPHTHKFELHNGSATGSPGSSRWHDTFQLYEDVCLLCATMWMGLGTWRSNSRASFSSQPASESKSKASEWGSVRLQGDDDWSLNGTHMRTLGKGIEGVRKRGQDDWDGAKMRNLGKGIEGRPSGSGSKAHIVDTPPKNVRKPSTSSTSKAIEPSEGEQEEEPLAAEEREELRQQNIQTTLALLQTFHSNTVFWLSTLHEIIPPPSVISSPSSGMTKFPSRNTDLDVIVDDADVVTISSRDLMTLELGVLSELDARFVEWLVEAEGYVGSSSGRKLVVRRGWQELLGIVFGFR